jgi:hypothetical protein
MRSSLLIFLATAAIAGEPFGIQVQDENTGRGVPMVTLETVNGIRLITDSAGWVAFDEPGLMKQRVHFTVSTPGYTFPKDSFGVAGLMFEAKPGTTVDLRLVRSNLAERLYRITGQGIYRDSTLLGKDSALPLPNLAGGVMAQSDAQMAVYQGKCFWLWGNTQRAAHPNGNGRCAGATSDLPASGGLDSTQGIHFSYFVDDRGDTLPMLPGKEPGTVKLEGLVSVKDASGAEHLIAHYAREEQGKLAEHGLAEITAQREFERITVLGADYTWQFPQGHAVRVIDEKDKTERYYFATPLAHVRVPAIYEAMTTPTRYEALAWDEDKGEVVWQQAAPPMTREDEDTLITKKRIQGKEERMQLTDALTHKELKPRSGSIRWNAFLKAWIMIFGTDDSSIWLAQSPSVDGPWHKAVQLATHEGHKADAVAQFDVFNQEQGKLVYFQCTIGAGDVKTPRYDGNAIMYRVDLSDARFQ